MSNNDGDYEITLGVLTAVEKNSNVTQRGVAKDVGIALGLANTYLKRCVKKGLIKVKQVPANRYAYYLTPRGFAEKSRLTAEYLIQGFQFFRLTKSQLAIIFETCQRRNLKNLALYGLSEISEIAILCSTNYEINIIGIIETSSSLEEYEGIPIVPSIDELASLEAIIITDLGEPQIILNNLSKSFKKNLIFSPPILNLFYNDPVEGEVT